MEEICELLVAVNYWPGGCELPKVPYRILGNLEFSTPLKLLFYSFSPKNLNQATFPWLLPTLLKLALPTK